jgi:hypothetical protein
MVKVMLIVHEIAWSPAGLDETQARNLPTWLILPAPFLPGGIADTPGL